MRSVRTSWAKGRRVECPQLRWQREHVLFLGARF